MKKVIIEELGITIPEPENYRDCFMFNTLLIIT